MHAFPTSWKYLGRRKYQRLDGAVRGRRSIGTVRLGEGGPAKRRSWRIRIKPKVRLPSPARLLSGLKNAYINMMLRLAGNVGAMNGPGVFGDGRVPKGRFVAPVVYTSEEVEERLVFEIYKALMATRDLAPKECLKVD